VFSFVMTLAVEVTDWRQIKHTAALHYNAA